MKESPWKIAAVFFMITAIALGIAGAYTQVRYLLFANGATAAEATIVGKHHGRVMRSSGGDTRFRYEYALNVSFFVEREKHEGAGNSESPPAKAEGNSGTDQISDKPWLSFLNVKPGKFGRLVLADVEVGGDDFDRFQEGDRVPILYQQENPQEVMLKDRLRISWVGVTFALISLALGVFCYRRALHPSEKRASAK